MKWPKKGDHPFIDLGEDDGSAVWVSLRWLNQFRTDDADLAEGFREAADRIVMDLERGGKIGHSDVLFLPVAYLYRHSFELQMKRVISLGIELGRHKESNGLRDALRHHNLASLWHHTREILVATWPKGPRDDLNAAGVIVQHFHTVDSSGETFRYTEDLDGKSTLERLPESASLRRLRRVSGGLSNMLSGCIDALENELETKREMEEYYRGD